MSSFRSCVSDGSLQAAAHCRVSSLAMASRLKKSLRAEERKRADVARARRRWIREQGWLDTTRLVFIDETAITTYMRATLSRSFFVISISSLPAFQEGLVQAQFCIDGTAGPFAWPRFRGQPPEPAGSRRKARGVDGESARRATMVSGHYAANLTALLLILFFSVDVPMTSVQLEPRRSPFAMRHLRRINLYPVGARAPYQGPSCNSARAQGS